MYDADLQRWLEEDLGRGDVTTAAVVEAESCNAVVTGGPGVLSGLAPVGRLLDMGGVVWSAAYRDGDSLAAGDEVLRLAGPSREVLARERLLLNLLSHLSGIATLTAQVVAAARAANPRVQVLATRKTLPGLRALAKVAVVHGGGGTHRRRLDDAVLIKDNHLRLCGSLTEAVRRARARHSGEGRPRLLIEAEADTPEQAREAAHAGADRVMLDNFTPAAAAKAAAALRETAPSIEIEISGGLTPANVAAYAPHADYLSLGVLTMGAPPVDFSLHVA